MKGKYKCIVKNVVKKYQSGNIFCTNCGKSINEEYTDNIKNYKKVIIFVFIIIFIIIGIVILKININNNPNNIYQNNNILEANDRDNDKNIVSDVFEGNEEVSEEIEDNGIKLENTEEQSEEPQHTSEETEEQGEEPQNTSVETEEKSTNEENTNEGTQDNDVENNTLIETPKLVGLNIHDVYDKVSGTGMYIKDIKYLYTSSQEKSERVVEQTIPAGTKVDKYANNPIDLKVYKYLPNVYLETDFELKYDKFEQKKYVSVEVKFNGQRVYAGYPDDTIMDSNPRPITSYELQNSEDNYIKAELYLDNNLVKSQTFYINLKFEGAELNVYDRIEVNKLTMDITEELRELEEKN